MRNSIRLPARIGEQLNRFVDFNSAKTSTDSNQPHEPIDRSQDRDSTVEGRWEHLKYFDDKTPVDSSYSSMTSSSTNSRSDEVKDSKLDKIRKSGWRKFKRRFLPSTKSDGHSSSPRPTSSKTFNDFGVISNSPAGAADADPNHDPNSRVNENKVSGVLPRIRSSKSMQNLDRITRDSYYNLREVTANMRQKYHSKLELRQAKPKADYREFWDEDSDMDEEEIRRKALAMVGLW